MFQEVRTCLKEINKSDNKNIITRLQRRKWEKGSLQQTWMDKAVRRDEKKINSVQKLHMPRAMKGKICHNSLEFSS